MSEKYSIQITNFRGISNKTVTLPRNGLLLLDGPSGSGKSTFLASLRWLLYGKVRNIAPRDRPLVRSTVKLTCLKDDQVLFTIERRTRAKQLTFTKESDDIRLIGDGAQSSIDRLFGMEEDSKLLSWILQKSEPAFAQMTSTQKLETLERICLLGSSCSRNDNESTPEEMRVQLKNEKKKLNNEREQIEAKISGAESALHYICSDVERERLSLLNSLQDDRNIEMKDLKIKISKQESEVNNELLKKNKINSDISILRDIFENHKKEIESLSAVYEKQKTELKIKKSQIDADQSNLNTHRNTKDVVSKELSEAKLELELLHNSGSGRTNLITLLDKQNSVHAKLVEEHSNMFPKLDEWETRLRISQDSLEFLTLEKEYLSTKKMYIESTISELREEKGKIQDSLDRKNKELISIDLSEFEKLSYHLQQAPRGNIIPLIDAQNNLSEKESELSELEKLIENGIIVKCPNCQSGLKVNEEKIQCIDDEEFMKFSSIDNEDRSKILNKIKLCNREIAKATYDLDRAKNAELWIAKSGEEGNFYQIISKLKNKVKNMDEDRIRAMVIPQEIAKLEKQLRRINTRLELALENKDDCLRNEARTRLHKILKRKLVCKPPPRNYNIPEISQYAPTLLSMWKSEVERSLYHSRLCKERLHDIDTSIQKSQTERDRLNNLLNEDKTMLTSAGRRVKKLTEKLEKSKTRISEIENALKVLTVDYDNLNLQSESNLSKLLALRKEYSDNQTILDSHLSLLEKCVNNESNIQCQITVMKERQRDIDALNHELDHLTSKKNKFDIHLSEIDVLKKTITEKLAQETIVNRMLDIIERTSREALDRLVSTVNLHFQKYLEEFFQEDSTATSIRLRLTRQTKTRKDKPQVNFSSLLSTGNSEYGLSQYSGGEQDRVHVAFLLALAEQYTLPLVILDEVLSSLDEESAAKVLARLHTISQSKLVIVVAHQAVTGIFDTIIKL